MEFSTLMGILFDLNSKIPDLNWNLVGMFDDQELVIRIPVDEENATLLRQAVQMFSAR